MDIGDIPERVTRAGKHAGGKDLLPTPLPDGWVVLERRDGEHSVLVWFGHRAPVAGADVADFSSNSALPDEAHEGCDYVAHVTIEPAGSPEAERAEQASSAVIHYRGLQQMIKDAIASADSAAIDEASRKIEQVVSSPGVAQDTDYLGERARGTRAVDGSMVVHSVTIGTYTLRGPLLGSEAHLPAADAPVHSKECLRTAQSHPQDCACKSCSPHAPCSTRRAERMISREEVEDFIRTLFAHIRYLEGL